LRLEFIVVFNSRSAIKLMIYLHRLGKCVKFASERGVWLPVLFRTDEERARENMFITNIKQRVLVLLLLYFYSTINMF
jgi:hypothetical protein